MTAWAASLKYVIKKELLILPEPPTVLFSPSPPLPFVHVDRRVVLDLPLGAHRDGGGGGVVAEGDSAADAGDVVGQDGGGGGSGVGTEHAFSKVI